MTLADRGERVVLSSYPPRLLTLERGDGSRVYDQDGIAYLDLIAGLAALVLGHGHEAPIAAFAAQARQLGHVSNLFWTEPAVVLAERLVELSGLGGSVFFANSGAEANEAAIKLARRHARATSGVVKHEIVCLHGGFHGRTMGALSATGNPAKQAPFAPLVPGFRHVAPNDDAALRDAVGPSTAAILLEPVLGEGGVWPLRADYLALARALADHHQALLILDEVQTGIGRCGAWFAFQRLGVTPDAITLAKGLANGLPIGALVTRPLEASFAAGEHGSTFGGSPPITAAALAVLDAIDHEDLIANALRIGEYLTRSLSGLDHVTGVRGLGLLLGVELDADATAVSERLRRDQQVLVNAVTPTALRLCPPLNLSHADAERAVDAVRAVLTTSVVAV